jgi:hypothetical protein
MEDTRAWSKVIATSTVEDDTKTDAVTKLVRVLPLETLLVNDESEIHIESWLAVETMRTEGEWEEIAENLEPKTNTPELPEDGVFLRNKEETWIASNEKESDKLDCCD